MSFTDGPRLRPEAYVSPSHLLLLSKPDSCGRDSAKNCYVPIRVQKILFMALINALNGYGL
jgi:hypothetical protein